MVRQDQSDAFRRHEKKPTPDFLRRKWAFGHVSGLLPCVLPYQDSNLERAWSSGRYDPWLESPSEFRTRKRRRESVTVGKALSLFLDEKRTAGCSSKTFENYDSF